MRGTEDKNIVRTALDRVYDMLTSRDFRSVSCEPCGEDIRSSGLKELS